MDSLLKVDIGNIMIQFVVLLFSLSIHEASHAWMADRLGDYTARYLGRVSLNPIVHIDPIGTVLFPLLQFFTNLPLIGWAKPVPINPTHLKNGRRDQMIISLAGPGSNLLAGGISFFLLAGMKSVSPEVNGLIINMIMTSSVPRQRSILAPIVGMLFFAMIINVALAVFNFIPIPPLDGHWMLYGVLPYNAAQVLEKISGYGFLVLYGLMFLGMFEFIFIPVRWVRDLLLVI